MSNANNVSMKHCMLTWKYCTFCQDFVHSLRKVDFQPAVFKLTKKAGPTLTFALPQVKYCCLNHRLLHHPEDHEEPWPIVVKYKPGVSSCFSWWTGADVSSQHFDGLVGLAWLVVVKYKPGMRWKRSCLSC